jgi:endoglucanase
MANQTAYLDDMLRWSLDWLIKVGLRDHCHLTLIEYNICQAHPQPNTLFVQVADGLYMSFFCNRP